MVHKRLQQNRFWDPFGKSSEAALAGAKSNEQINQRVTSRAKEGKDPNFISKKEESLKKKSKIGGEEKINSDQAAEHEILKTRNVGVYYSASITSIVHSMVNLRNQLNIYWRGFLRSERFEIRYIWRLLNAQAVFDFEIPTTPTYVPLPNNEILKKMESYGLMRHIDLKLLFDMKNGCHLVKEKHSSCSSWCLGVYMESALRLCFIM
ncbi:unnamed protein product [Lactuca saligna]|uniref:Uncharacterized protein n=1 Tax=Lactuca saligna TaxID=75948 RepID=A0AA35VD61_LACSI|nr:unnamed protein product [Lactuca saligna]